MARSGNSCPGLFFSDMRILIAVLIILLLLLQYKLWFAEGGLIKVWHLNEAVEQQQIENEKLKERNRALEAEVRDLKQGLEAIEERARSELGMIGRDETYYQVIEE